MKVFLFGALFLITSHSFALRDKSNESLDSQATKLAEKYPDLSSFSKTVNFVKIEKWDSVLVHTQKLLQQTKKSDIIDFIHYYRAEAFHKKGLFKYALSEFNLVQKDFEFYTIVLLNKGAIFIVYEKFNQALDSFKSIDTTNTENMRMIRLDALFHNMAVCYSHLGYYSKAEKYLLSAIEKIEKKKDEVALIASLMDLGTVYYEQYLDEKAIAYFERAYLLSKKYGTHELKQNAALNMSVVEENRKRYDVALQYRKEYEDWKDSLNDQNKIYEVAQIEKKLALGQKQQRIELLKTENKLKQAELRNSFFVLLFLLAILIFGIYFYRQNVLRSRVILKQKQELDLLNATKDQLFSIVSHDLRSSVHALRVSNTHLKDKVEKQEFASLESQLEENSMIATNTYNMLDNLLNWALLQTEGGYFRPEEHRLSMLIDQVVFNFKGVLNQKEITFENTIPKSVKVVVDAESLKIVFRNFMDNSIKFSNPGSKITVNLKVEDENKVSFNWEDTGKGMSEETRIKLLSDSPQLTKKDHEKEIGSGLGMNLCKAMLAKNAGNLDIWSKLNEGTKITVTLKRKQDGKN